MSFTHDIVLLENVQRSVRWLTEEEEDMEMNFSLFATAIRS